MLQMMPYVNSSVSPSSTERSRESAIKPNTPLGSSLGGISMTAVIGETSIASPVVDVRVTCSLSDSSGVVSLTTDTVIIVSFCSFSKVTTPEDGVMVTSSDEADT